MTDFTQKTKLKNLSHCSIINLVRAFAPKVHEGGVCNGFTSMWLQAVLTSEEDERLFYERLDLFSSYLQQNSTTEDLKQEIDSIYSTRAKSIIKPNFTDEVLKKLEVRAFAEAVAIQQGPMIISKKYSRQGDKKTLYPLTASKKLEQQNVKFNIDNIGVLIPTLEELEKYFEEIKAVLIKLNQDEKISFLLDSEDHTTGVYFDKNSGKFHYLDINQFYSKTTYYAEVDSKEFATLIFESFFTGQAIEKYSPFSIMAISRDKSPILIEQLQSITQKTLLPTASENRKNSNNTTALWLACKSGHTEIIELLLQNGALESINTLNKNGNTPLWIACHNGHQEIVELLLKHDALDSINTLNKNGNTPLWIACQNGHTEIVALLLQNDALDSINIPDINRCTPLFIACHNGHQKIAALLLQNGAIESINTPNKNGTTPLFMACKEGHTEIVEFLLKNGALESINTPNKLDGTPLYAACHNGHLDIVSLLLKLGITQSINLTTNTDNTTPLFVACKNGHAKIVALLLQSGAIDSITISDIEKNTPFSIAQKNGHTDIVALLQNLISLAPASPILLLSNANKRKAEDILDAPAEKKAKPNEEKMNEDNPGWPCLIM